MNNKTEVEVIIPILDKDINFLMQWLIYIKKNIPYKKIIIISNKNAKEIVKGYSELYFIDEESLIPVEKVRNLIREISGNDEAAVKRSGWYVQQFIKLEYSKICEDEYYLSWDGDTFPLKEVQLFEDNKPVFGIKNEHHEPYFKVISELLGIPAYSCDVSYISEHMLFNASVVREMLRYIEKNSGYSNYYECILNKIDKTELSRSGFSEFETYGAYCGLFHSDMYISRTWKSLRPADNFFDFSKIDDDSLAWISKKYDAVTIEKSWQVKGYKRIVILIIRFIMACRITHRLSDCEKVVLFIEKRTKHFNEMSRKLKG